MLRANPSAIMIGHPTRHMTATEATFDDQESVYSSDTALTPTSLPRTPTLTLTKIQPEQLNESADAAERICAIQWIEVVAEKRVPDLKATYEIQVFTKRQHGHLHLSSVVADPHPAHRSLLTQLTRPNGEPDFRVRRRAADFHRLRHQIMDAVQSHHRTLCEQCTGLQSLLIFSVARPASVAWPFLPTKAKVTVLTTLLRSLVDRYASTQPPPSTRRHSHHPCQGMRDVPLLLDQFLFGDSHDHDGALSSTHSEISCVDAW